MKTTCKRWVVHQMTCICTPTQCKRWAILVPREQCKNDKDSATIACQQTLTPRSSI